MTPKVLLVDDDANLLAGLRRSLDGDDYEVHIAQGGENGLRVFQEEGPFEVTIADMRMPGLDGVEYLKQIGELNRDTVRVMLTGNVDQKTAIDAVNEGHVFRFLSKPCDPDEVDRCIRDALHHYRLLTTERELLSQTLTGCVKMVTDLLALVNPHAAAQASRIQRIAHRLARQSGCQRPWEVELAAMLFQIGWITVPDQSLFAGVRDLPPPAHISHDLVANIPRLEGVASIIEAIYAVKEQGASSVAAKNAIASKDIDSLRLAIDLDELMEKGFSPNHALEELAKVKANYNPQAMAALSDLLTQEVDARTLPMEPDELADGDIVAEDVTTFDGRLLLRSGQEISPALRRRLVTSATSLGIRTPIRILGSCRADSLNDAVLGEEALPNACELLHESLATVYDSTNSES